MNEEKETYLSKEKHAELVSELDELKTVKRKEIAEKLEYARSRGDLAENAEYHEAREEQARIEKHILELEAILKTAVVVEKHHSDTVEVGSVVVVQKKGEQERKTFQIVGSEETDMAQGKISNISPLGDALLGHKKEEIASFESPSGTVQYTIIDIE